MVITVKELIEELQKCDPSYEVGIKDADSGWELKVQRLINGEIHNRILIEGDYDETWG